MRLLTWVVCFTLCPSLLLSQEKALYLNPENALGAKASILFSAAELIPLETTKASYFTNMQDFLVTPAHFVFLDNASNAVFFFNKEGKFLYKYKKKKYRIQSIQYVHEKNAVLIAAQNKNYTIPPAKAQRMIQQSEKTDFSKYTSLELLHLDAADRYKVTVLPVPRYVLNNSTYYFDGRLLTINNRYNKYLKDTVAYHLNLIDGNKISQSYFPFLNIPKLPPFYEPVGFSIKNATSARSLFIQKQFDNTIYTLTPDSLYTSYKFVFPADQTMPGDFQSTAFKNNIDFNTAKNKNNKVVTSFQNMVEHKNMLFFTMSTLSYARKSLAFNTTDNKLYDLGKITTDSTVYFLPPKIFSTISEQDADYVYTKISSADLLKEKEKLVAQNKDLPESTRLLLTNLSKFDNAIIIKLKINPSTAK